jgi:N-acetylglucosaminyldiphosphoundecaprenol N-acetyl-beta-D-mannosaminyltransferase
MSETMRDLKLINFIGIGVHALTYDDMFDRIDLWLQDKEDRSHHIACLNAFGLSLTLNDPLLTRIFGQADIAGPDGMPFVYWIRRIHGESCDRFYAPDIVLQIAQHAKKKDYSFYLYGGAPEIVLRMKQYLQDRFPYLRIIGTHAPPFRELTEDEDQAICAEINALRPDILCVGLGTPKQDYWIDSHIYKIPGSVMISCGATFDFFGGRVRMAPRFIQRSGFEWLYRLLGRDFNRLFKRYTLMHGKFIWNFGLQLLKLKHQQAIRMEREGSRSDNNLYEQSTR